MNWCPLGKLKPERKGKRGSGLMVGPLAFTGTAGQMFLEGLASNNTHLLFLGLLSITYPLVGDVFSLSWTSLCPLYTDVFPLVVKVSLGWSLGQEAGWKLGL